MSDPFYEHPILNSPYEYPRSHWELDEDECGSERQTHHGNPRFGLGGGSFGRWAFAEFTEVFEIEKAFNELLLSIASGGMNLDV